MSYVHVGKYGCPVPRESTSNYVRGTAGKDICPKCNTNPKHVNKGVKWGYCKDCAKEYSRQKYQETTKWTRKKVSLKSK